MKLVTTDDRVLNVNTAGSPCGYRIQTMELNARDFSELYHASTEQKLQWFKVWFVRFPIVEIKGSSVLKVVYDDLSNLKNVMLENRVKELEVMLRKLATESDCYLEEMLDTGSADTSAFADTITEAEQLYQKQAGFKDDS